MPKVITEQFISLLQESIQKGAELSSMAIPSVPVLILAKDELQNWDTLNTELLVKGYYYDHNRHYENYDDAI